MGFSLNTSIKIAEINKANLIKSHFRVIDKTFIKLNNCMHILLGKINICRSLHTSSFLKYAVSKAFVSNLQLLIIILRKVLIDMFCTCCGKQLKDDSKFCDGCGTPLGAGAPKRAETVQTFPQQAPSAITEAAAAVEPAQTKAEAFPSMPAQNQFTAPNTPVPPAAPAVPAAPVMSAAPVAPPPPAFSAPPVADIPQQSNYSYGRLKFVGKGGSLFWLMFKIGLLTMITFGIYCPWGYVRIKRFVLENSILDGKRMGFTGTGGQLWGQIIVLWLLSMITIGIYGPWGYCRIQRWIADNTVIEG